MNGFSDTIVINYNIQNGRWKFFIGLLEYQRHCAHNHVSMFPYPLVRFLLEFLELPYEEKRYTSMEEWFGGDL